MTLSRLESKEVNLHRCTIMLTVGILFGVLGIPIGAVADPQTLRQALAYAREHAARVEARGAERDRVRAEARARGFWLPEPPSVSGEWTKRERLGEEIHQDRVLEGTLAVEPFQVVFRAQAAGAERHAGLSEVDSQARAWAADVGWTYHERLRRLWVHDRTVRQATIARRLADVVQRRFGAGDASQLDLDLARVDAAEASRRVFDAERGMREAHEALAAAIGWPTETSLPEPDSLELVPAFPDTTELLDRALLQRPQLLVVRATLDHAKAEARLANADLFPRAELSAFGGQEEGDDVSGLRLGLSLPFLGSPVMERGARAAQKRRVEAELRAATRDAYAEVKATQFAATLAFQQVSLYLREILPGIQEARQRYQEAYAVGQIDLTTVLLSEQRYRDAERSFGEALGTYIEALRELELATGLPVLSGYPLDDEPNR